MYTKEQNVFSNSLCLGVEIEFDLVPTDLILTWGLESFIQRLFQDRAGGTFIHDNEENDIESV